MSERPPRPKAPPKRLAVIGAVVVLAAVVLLRMNEDGGSGVAAAGPLRFQTSTVKAVSTGGEARPADAQAVLPAVRDVVRSFYTEAFLNPSNWKSGNYDSAWKLFSPDAAAAAKAHSDTLTLGTDAADTYSSIQPETGLLGLRVLLNEHGKPLSAFALVTFAADAKTPEGVQDRVISVSRFALEPDGDTWRITGFRSGRQDHPADGSPPTSASEPPASPTGEGTMVGLAHPAESFPTYEDQDPIYFLVIGDSYRAGQSHLADSIHIVSLNPSSGSATILGIPRDSWVPIPGHGTNKINAAFALGGPELMIQTVEGLTGLKMDYYAVTTFGGFTSIIKDLGGLDIKIPYEIHDPGSKANFRKGKTELTGKEALRFARSRDDVPNGDFSRQYNEGLILLALLQQFQDSFEQEPGSILTWIGAGMGNVQTDLSFDQIMALAYLASEIKAGNVTNIVVPARYGTTKDQSIVTWEPEAQQIFDDMADNGVLDTEHQGADV